MPFPYLHRTLLPASVPLSLSPPIRTQEPCQGWLSGDSALPALPGAAGFSGGQAWILPPMQEAWGALGLLCLHELSLIHI